MAYKWKPSKAQKQAFKERMQDEEEQKAYEERKQQKVIKRREKSIFDYGTAGGFYVPTKEQFLKCLDLLQEERTDKERNACNQVIFGYNCNEKVHHDNIHIVNELIRKMEFIKA